MVAPSSSASASPDDRRVVEHIRGRPLSQDRPAVALAAGSRVTVVHDPDGDGPWRNEFPGTIDDMGAPELVENVHARPGEMAYWVAFDAPQYDGDGGGPYRKAQIWDRYLRPGPPLPPRT
ncbi:ferrous iron transport protein A [Streptomyces sp. NPDC059496]|uniref:ferrous iron transport protein A n=1 Tax=Streptomyces sp. NPDC059496 TaxID=3346851 RepID=UPI0036BC60E1